MTTPTEQERQFFVEQNEIERQLELADREQADAMPGWKDLLTNMFGRNRTDFTAAQKAAVIGAPGRRQMLKFGGVSVAGAALLAACGSDSNEAGDTVVPESPDTQAPSTEAPSTEAPSTEAPSTEASSTEAPSSEPASSEAPSEDGAPTEMDLVLLRTATSLEIAAVDAYQAAIDAAGDLGITAPVAEAATLFQMHHQAHAEALQAGTEAAGGEPYMDANPFLMENVVTPALGELTDEASAVMLALMLENAASQTYTFAGSALSLPMLRQTIMSIGGVEERHAAVLRGVLSQPQVPNTFNPTEQAAPEDAFVGTG